MDTCDVIAAINSNLDKRLKDIHYNYIVLSVSIKLKGSCSIYFWRNAPKTHHKPAYRTTLPYSQLSLFSQALALSKICHTDVRHGHYRLWIVYELSDTTPQFFTNN